MNYGKRIALPRSSVTDSDSAVGDDFDEDGRGHRKSSSKDKVNRNLSEKKRRDQFNMLVNELCSMVSTNNKKMDKSTVLKSTIAFLKNYQETTVQAQVHEIKEDWKPSFLTNEEFMHLMLEALDSFLLVFTQQGSILYASESVTSLLGHLPSDLVNQSVFDFVTKAESDKLHNLLYNYSVTSGNGVPEYRKEENQLIFNCGFRCGSLVPSDEVVYESVTVRGSFRHWNGDPSCVFEDEDPQRGTCTSSLGSTQRTDNICFCSTVRLLSSQLVREMSLVDENKEFTSRHSLEWKFLFLDHRATPIIGYLPFEVLGTSGYDYYHPDDLEDIAKSHEQLMTTGNGTSCYYRFLTKGQQWIWLKTSSFITYHQWNSKPEFIVCTNTVVSYSDVRSHRRKELGIEELALVKRSCGSPSVGSVTSGSRIESSQWSLSPTQESAVEFSSVKIMSDRDSSDGSSRPHSTSSGPRNKTVSEQLQQFLQRHLQQQQQQALHTTTLPLQQLLQRRQQQQQQQYRQQQSQHQQQKQSHSHHVQHAASIQPEAVTSVVDVSSTSQGNGHSTGNYAETTTHSAVVSVIPSPSLLSVSSSDVQSRVTPAAIYMTPVQRQLHDQLQRKARQVQEAIMRQQEELRNITEQLSFAQHGTLVGQQVMEPAGSSQQQVVLTNSCIVPSCSTVTPSIPVPLVAITGHSPVIMNQSTFLPFPVMPSDADILLSHAEPADSSETPLNQQ